MVSRVMTLDARHARRRLYVVVLLTLLPWPAVWLGMYRLDSHCLDVLFVSRLLPAACRALGQ